ncbi:adenylate isopentenyltransferase 3, chloroplastic-like [Cornus florida]|uniref:adenylate isopentenyltransferase 3, chloroplastic-like n=1 Tax=Cornus florida TaxID=4283 RepID=UPI00289E4C9C|nr:adenylate isopentenyltransferase 3, chloroplastic-like [Cornus florida]
MESHYQKTKVVFIMGATGVGKSQLSVDIATRFPAEIINSDKMQVYKGLDIVTNKSSVSERRGVPHHLLGEFEPDTDFTAHDFCRHAGSAIERIVKSGQVPIIVGGSNSYIEALVEDPSFNFKSKYDCCFIWVDVSLPVLHYSVAKRVDDMVRAGLVEEVRKMYVPEADYTRGIRRSIGVPEMDKYFRAEKDMDRTSKEMLLKASIEEIKNNTCKLVNCQLGKIQRMRYELGWLLHRIDATPVFEKCGEKCGKKAKDAWEDLVIQPTLDILNDFFRENEIFVANDTMIIPTTMIQPMGQLQVSI